MIPEDIEELDEEMTTSRGSSSLPVTKALEDEDNFDIMCNFLYVLYKGARCETEKQKVQQGNEERCAFWKIARLHKAVVHYDEKCVGSNCPELHCRQAVDLHVHWINCRMSDCFICSSTVDLLMDKFCQHLAEKGEEYDRVVLRIKMASLAAKKEFIQRLIAGMEAP